MLPLSRVPAASKAPPAPAAASPAAVSLRSSVLALTSDLQDFAPFAPETPGSPPAPRENNLAGRFLSTLCPAPGGPCYQPPADYYCGLSKESSLESQGSSTLSSPSECLSAPPASTPDCSPRGSATLFQFPIGKILEEEAGVACPPREHGCFQGEQAPEEADGRSPPPAEDACPPPSPCRPSPSRGPGEGPPAAEEIQRYEHSPRAPHPVPCGVRNRGTACPARGTAAPPPPREGGALPLLPSCVVLGRRMQVQPPWVQPAALPSCRCVPAGWCCRSMTSGITARTPTSWWAHAPCGTGTCGCWATVWCR